DRIAGRTDVLNIAGQKRADPRWSSAADHNYLGFNAVFSEDALLFGHPQSAVKRADRAEADADFVLRSSRKVAQRDAHDDNQGRNVQSIHRQFTDLFIG